MPVEKLSAEEIKLVNHRFVKYLITKRDGLISRDDWVSLSRSRERLAGYKSTGHAIDWLESGRVSQDEGSVEIDAADLCGPCLNDFNQELGGFFPHLEGLQGEGGKLRRESRIDRSILASDDGDVIGDSAAHLLKTTIDFRYRLAIGAKDSRGRIRLLKP